MLESLEKIPKGINIIVFIWAMIGLFLLLRDPKIRKEKMFHVCLAVVGFMAVWRILANIDTSRYAAGLILPFVVFASYFLYNSRKRRHGFVRFVLYVAIACSGFIILKMNCDSVTRNESAVVVSETFRTIDATNGNHMFRAPWKDFRRIYYYSHMKDNIMGVYDPAKLIMDYNYVFKDMVLNIEAKNIADYPDVQKKLKQKYKLIASLIEESNVKKKQFIYILSSDNRCVPVLKEEIPPYRPNLLDNGDLEELDTPEESLEKLKSHFKHYAQSTDVANMTVRTPRAACFSAESSSSSLPEASALNDFRIAGNNSARIRIPHGTASMVFDRRFSNGDYEYSVLTQGKKGTRVRLLYEVGKGGSREVRQIATLLIPDGRLFLITAHFSVEDLGQDDFFQVGASVQNGEAYLDNFSLTTAEPVTSAATIGAEAD